jgi:hypothetical protein
MRKTIRIALLLAVIAIGITPLAVAEDSEYWRRYYSDPQHTNLVGAHIVDCDGEHWFWGTLQGYLVEDWYPCP